MPIINYLKRQIIKNQNVPVSQTKNINVSDDFFNYDTKDVPNLRNLSKNSDIHAQNNIFSSKYSVNSQKNIIESNLQNNSSTANLFEADMNKYTHSSNIIQSTSAEAYDNKSSFGGVNTVSSNNDIRKFTTKKSHNNDISSYKSANISKSEAKNYNFTEFYRYLLEELKKEMRN